MKPGATTITPATSPSFPPTVNVGDNDRAVRVAFGQITIYLSNVSDPAVVIVRAEGHDARGNAAPVETRGAAEVETVNVDVDVEQPVDVVYCDRQAQEALWARLCAEQAGVLEKRGDLYALAQGAVWIDAGNLALRVECGADGVKVGAFGRGDAAGIDGLPLRALHFLPGEA